MLCIVKNPADYVIGEFCFVLREYCVVFANLCCVLGKLCCVWIFQFSSVLISQSNYNARIHITIVSWQGSPEETRRLVKPGLPSHKEISKMKFA